MAVGGAAGSAGDAVTADGAGGWVGAAVPVAGPLELPADLDRARVQVHVLPAEPDRLGLPDADCEGDRPAGAVAPAYGCAEDAACLVTGQRLDVGKSADGCVDQAGNIASDLAAFPGDLQPAGDDPVDLHDRPCLALNPA